MLLWMYLLQVSQLWHTQRQISAWVPFFSLSHSLECRLNNYSIFNVLDTFTVYGPQYSHVNPSKINKRTGSCFFVFSFSNVSNVLVSSVKAMLFCCSGVYKNANVMLRFYQADIYVQLAAVFEPIAFCVWMIVTENELSCFAATVYVSVWHLFLVPLQFDWRNFQTMTPWCLWLLKIYVKQTRCHIQYLEQWHYVVTANSTSKILIDWAQRNV